MNRSALEEYKQRRIQGAKFFDLDGKFSDPDSSYPHMMPSKEIFWKHVSELGIQKDSFIVAYDGVCVFSSFSLVLLMVCM